MALAATIAAVMPLAFAGEPEAVAKPVSTFPEVVVRKAETPHEWAFSIDEGTLICIGMNGERYVFFSEILTDEEMGEFGNMKLPRSVVVATNPMAFFVTIENRELYLPFDTLETLITRLAPFETMGRKLCDDDLPKTQPQEL